MSGKSETYHFERALVGESLAENVLVEIDGEGVISAVRADAPATGAGRIEGIALPGMANLHSHAFQRAMAGLSERASEGGNNFWTWRQTLYRMLAELSAGDIEAIATLLYMEMLKAGYTSVGEFHYLHHRPDGKPYSNVAVTSEAIFKAANAAGLALTHLPALYMTSGFGDDHLSAEQRRFYNDYGRFSGLLKEIVLLAEGYSNISVGLALHSLRAVPQAVIGPAIQLIEGVAPGAPIHIHIAEQDQEVVDCLNFYDA
ncbi:MAG: amidohydrolase family protein, partial [Sphingomonadales bacterium]